MDSDYNGATCSTNEVKSNRGTRGPRAKKYKVSSSTGFKGVYYSDKGKKHYHCHVSFWHQKGLKPVKQYTFHIGSFHTAEEANMARIKFITDLL